MVTDLVKLHSLLGVGLQKFGDQVLCHPAEAPWPLDPLMQNIVKELLLVFADEGRITRQ